jgi:hypothetical protein
MDKDFIPGDLVEKHRGEARWIGVVVSVYATLRGADRIVVDVLPQRFQMIATGEQVRLLARGLDRDTAVEAGLLVVASRVLLPEIAALRARRMAAMAAEMEMAS